MATVTGYTVTAVDDLVTGAKARSAHTGTQPASTISDLTETVQDIVGATLVAGTNVTLNYNDAANTLTVNSTASGGSTATEGIFLSSYTNGLGTAAANTTAIQNAINAADTAKKPLINDLGSIDVNINARINLVFDRLKARFNGLHLIQNTQNAAGVRFGGEGQDIDGLRVTNSGNPTSTHTDANGMEFTNCLFSRFTNLVASNWARGFFMPQAAPAIGDPGSNTVFSCNFENIRINGWAISGLDFQTWPAGGGASTGNSWDNTYIHNNYFGPVAACTSWGVIFRGFDETAFDQFNFEWCAPPGDAIFLQESKNMVFDSLHFEGVTLTGNSALLRTYFDVRAVIHAASSKTTTIANDAGQKSFFRGYSTGGNPASLDVTSVRVRSTINAGSRPWGLAEVEAGATGVDFVFRRADVDNFNGNVVLDNTTVVPSQIESYNDVRLRSVTGPNIRVDKVRAANTAAITNTTLVTDSTLTFPTTAGTYLIEGELYYTVPAAADLKFRFNHAAAATGKFIVNSLSSAATVATAQGANWQSVLINTDTVAGGVDSTEVGFTFRGTLTVTTAGTFAIQYAENAASGSLIVGIQSRLSYRKVS